MEPLKTQGIVTRAVNVGESGKMLTVLSADMGKISIWGKGLGSSKHPAKGASSPFSLSEFVINQKGDVYSLSSASLIRNFYGLSKSVEKLSLANYFCSLSEAILVDEIYAPHVLKLLLNSLHFLEGDLKEFYDLWMMFEIKALEAAGAMPNLKECVICGGKPSLNINVAAGGSVCGICTAGSIKISPKSFSLMEKYIEIPLSSALSGSGGDIENIKNTLSITGKFIEEHISKMKSRDYLKKIVRM